MKRIIAVVIGSIIIGVGSVWGAAPPSIASGQQLFNSEGLGLSGTSCASCHAGGKKLGGVKDSSDEQLIDTVNACITGPLRGKQLDPQSAEIKSLVLYLKSLANSGK